MYTCEETTAALSGLFEEGPENWQHTKLWPYFLSPIEMSFLF